MRILIDLLVYLMAGFGGLCALALWVIWKDLSTMK